MAIKVDPRLSQTENLMRLIKSSGVKDEVLQDIEGYSCFKREKTIRGKTYNTELHLHILPDSPTHYKEKNSHAQSNYNRIPVGFVGDEDYQFVYDEAKYGKLNLNRLADANEKVAKMINEFPHFSQEEKFPFRVEIHEDDKTLFTVYPSLASPCYTESKDYRLMIAKSLGAWFDKKSIFVWDVFTRFKDEVFVPYQKENGEIFQTINVSFTERENLMGNNLDAMVKAFLAKRNIPSRVDNVNYLFTNEKGDGRTTNGILAEFVDNPNLSIQAKTAPKQTAFFKTIDRNFKESMDLLQVDLRATPDYTDKLTLTFARHHFSNLFIRFLQESVKYNFIGSVSAVDDVQGKPYSIPKGDKVLLRMDAENQFDAKYGTVIRISVLNGIADTESSDDLPNNHSYTLFTDMIYRDFIGWLRIKNIDLVGNIGLENVTDRAVKQALGSHERNNLVKVTLNDTRFSLFLAGDIYVDCIFRRTSEFNTSGFLA